MNVLNSFNQTKATIKILETLQTLRSELGDAIIVNNNNQVCYNQHSGLCYLFLEYQNICICADEFGNDAYIELSTCGDDDVETHELTIKEYLTWAN